MEVEVDSEKPHELPKRITMGPFDLLPAVEESLAIKIAKDFGIKFAYEPPYIEKNIAMPLNQIKTELQRLYICYQEQG